MNTMIDFLEKAKELEKLANEIKLHFVLNPNIKSVHYTDDEDVKRKLTKMCLLSSDLQNQIKKEETPF